MSEPSQRVSKGREEEDASWIEGALPRFDIVCYLAQEWDILPRRPHLTALARFCRVLLVQVPLTIDSPLRKPRKFLRWVTGRDRLSQLSENLFLARPLMAVPYGLSFRYPLFRPLNRWLMRWAIRGFIRRLGIQAKAAIVFNPPEGFLVGLAGEEIFCYEIVDEYTSYTGLTAAGRERIALEEVQLLQSADIVFVPNRGLYNEKSGLSPRTFVISNAADTTLFARAQAEETLVPADLECIPEPRIGYLGNFNELLDCEMLNYLARRHPEWSFVLLGRVSGERAFRRSAAFKTLRRWPNVHFLGWRDYTLLPDYLKGTSVCIIPWVVNHLTTYHGQPNKLFQYLAAGKPVVTTALPQIYSADPEIRHLVGIAKTYEEFEQLIAWSLHSGKDQTAVENRMRVARKYSSEKMAWERVRHIADAQAYAAEQ